MITVFLSHVCTLYPFFSIKLAPSLWRSLRINLRKWLTLELLLSRYRVGTWKKKGVQRRKGKKRKKLLIRTKCWGDQPQTCTWLALQISPWPKRRWGRNNGKVSTCFEIGLSSADGNIFLSDDLQYTLQLIIYDSCLWNCNLLKVMIKDHTTNLNLMPISAS